MSKTMSDEQFRDRVAQLFANESAEPMRWVYLSFADADGFRGGCVVEAKGIIGAVARCNVLGINPGGEVMLADIPDEVLASIPDDAKDVLLSRERLREVFGKLRSMKDPDSI